MQHSEEKVKFKNRRRYKLCVIIQIKPNNVSFFTSRFKEVANASVNINAFSYDFHI